MSDSSEDFQIEWHGNCVVIVPAQNVEDMRWDPKKEGVGTNDQTQWFGAVQYTLWNQIYFKFVFSHANNRVNNSGSGHYSNNQTGGRFRVMLLF